MKAEIVSVGTELLLGQLVDTNSVWLSQQLSMLGINSHFKTTVGDNAHNIKTIFKQATARAEIIIATGGLGPTQDDITKETLAKALGLELVYDEKLAQAICEKFTARNREMSQNNYRQAYYPKGAIVLDQFPGTAPGLYLSHNDRHYFLLPGVPYEMKAIFEGSIIPLLRKISPDDQQIYTEVIKLWGVPESDIAEKVSAIDDRLADIGNPKLSYLASGINGISVRLSAKAHNHDDALKIIKPYYEDIEEILAPYIFGHNGGTMEECILSLCNNKKLSLGCVEWFTGGMMASRLLAYGQTLDPFMGSVVRRDDFKHETLVQYQHELKADVIVAVTEHMSEKTTITECQLHLLIEDQYFSRMIQIPRHQKEETMAFAVINSFNFLKNQLQIVEL